MDTPISTIKNPTEAEFKDRGSKFLCYTFSVATKEDAKKRLQELNHSHPSAHHFCYAYILGADANEYRANDDGEPSGSAGLPILNQIKSKELTNTLVVVVRYFGGTKLGVSGLINAYKESAKMALEVAEISVVIPQDIRLLTFPHSRIGDVERIVRQNNWVLADQQFAMDCQWKIQFPASEKDTFLSLFKPLTDVQLS